jgi:hypothetical protein
VSVQPGRVGLLVSQNVLTDTQYLELEFSQLGVYGICWLRQIHEIFSRHVLVVVSGGSARHS